MTWGYLSGWNEGKRTPRPNTCNRKDHTPPSLSKIYFFMRCCSRKRILKIMQIEILSLQCSFKSNWWSASWHRHLTINLASSSRLCVEYGTSESSGDRISFGLITNHKDNGFPLTKIFGKLFCFWASNLCLDLDILLYLKRMHAC